MALTLYFGNTTSAIVDGVLYKYLEEAQVTPTNYTVIVPASGTARICLTTRAGFMHNAGAWNIGGTMGYLQITAANTNLSGQMYVSRLSATGTFKAGCSSSSKILSATSNGFNTNPYTTPTGLDTDILYIGFTITNSSRKAITITVVSNTEFTTNAAPAPPYSTYNEPVEQVATVPVEQSNIINTSDSKEQVVLANVTEADGIPTTYEELREAIIKAAVGSGNTGASGTKVFGYSVANYLDIIALDTTRSLIVYYNTNYIYAIVVTKNADGSLTYGQENSFARGLTGTLKLYLLDSNRVLMQSILNYSYCCVLTVNGNIVTKTTDVKISTYAATSVSMVAVSATEFIHIYYSSTYTEFMAETVYVTVANVITKSAETELWPYDTYDVNLFKVDDTHYFLASEHSYFGVTNYYYTPITYSSGSFTVGARTTIKASTGYPLIIQLDSTHYIFVDTYPTRAVRLITVNPDYTITIGSEVLFSNMTTQPVPYGIALDASTALIAYCMSGEGVRHVVVSYSNGNLTCSGEVVAAMNLSSSSMYFSMDKLGTQAIIALYNINVNALAYLFSIGAGDYITSNPFEGGIQTILVDNGILSEEFIQLPKILEIGLEQIILTPTGTLSEYVSTSIHEDGREQVALVVTGGTDNHLHLYQEQGRWQDIKVITEEVDSLGQSAYEEVCEQVILATSGLIRDYAPTYLRLLILKN